MFSTNFAPDDEIAFRLAVAGSKGAVQVWDTSTNKAVRAAFATRGRLPETTGEVKERMIVLEKDDEPDDDEDEGPANGQTQDGWESMDED